MLDTKWRHEKVWLVTQIPTSVWYIIEYRSIIIVLLKNKGTQYILYSIKYKFYICIELCACYCELGYPIESNFGFLQMVPVTKMRDAIYCGRVRTGYLTLRYIQSANFCKLHSSITVTSKSFELTVAALHLNMAVAHIITHKNSSLTTRRSFRSVLQMK